MSIVSGRLRQTRDRAPVDKTPSQIGQTSLFVAIVVTLHGRGMCRTCHGCVRVVSYHVGHGCTSTTFTVRLLFVFSRLLFVFSRLRG